MAADQIRKNNGVIFALFAAALVLPVIGSIVVVRAQCSDSALSRTLGVDKTCKTTEYQTMPAESQLSYKDAYGNQIKVDLSEMASFVKAQKGKGLDDFVLSTEGNNLTITAGGEHKTVDLSNLVQTTASAPISSPVSAKQTIKITGKVLTISDGNSIDLTTFLGLADYTAGAGVEVSGSRVISATANTSLVVGDVKSGMQASDHQGWIKLDGRAVSALTTSQQSAAQTLGITSNLPDADDAVPVQNGTSIGSVSGSNLRTIAQNQLPNETLDGTTDLAGGHSHTFTSLNMSGNGVFSIFGAPDSLVSGQSTSSTSFEPAHSHDFTTSSINGGVTQQQLDITPKSLSVNMFIYLGL